MPTEKKIVRYKIEQKKIINKMFQILNLDDHAFILYELDNDNNKKTNILELVTDVKKYFSSSCCRGINNKQCKRPYLSVIKFLIKKNGNELISIDHQYKNNDNIIRTKKYKII